MINTTELRIGNYFHPTKMAGGVKLPMTSVYLKVGAVNVIGEIQVIDVKATHVFSSADVEPVILTTEILEKSGFEYDQYTYSLGSFWLSEGKHGDWAVWLHGLSNGVTTTVRCVHELQNLFYCVKGAELKIDLK